MWTLQDAKNRFSAVVDAALAGEPQHVSRRGKPAVVVVDAAEFARLNAVAGRPDDGFLDHLLAFPQGGPENDEDLFPRLPSGPMREIEW